MGSVYKTCFIACGRESPKPHTLKVTLRVGPFVFNINCAVSHVKYLICCWFWKKPQMSPVGGAGRGEAGLKTLLNAPSCWPQLATDTFIFVGGAFKTPQGSHTHPSYLAPSSFLSSTRRIWNIQLFKKFSFIFKGTRFKGLLSSSMATLQDLWFSFALRIKVVLWRWRLYLQNKCCGKSNELKARERNWKFRL